MKVILIHGMFCDTRCWDFVEPLLLKRGATVQKLTLHPDKFTKCGRGIAAVARSVESQLNHIKNQRFLVVAHSSAAIIIQKILPIFPNIISILINPSPGWGSFAPAFPLWIAAKRGRFWTKTVKLDRKECQKLLFQGMSEKEIEKAFERVEPESGELVREVFWFFDLFGASTRIAPLPDRDIIILTGDLDPLATPNYCKKLLAKYGDSSKLIVVNGAGHMSILQEKGAFNLLKIITEIQDAEQSRAGNAR